ncbi:MAG: type II secretion system protein [Candidatus Omnitrophica bacterium]|nr:type II secretion system protein [Candidatus Omnitrophota bacterium]
MNKIKVKRLHIFKGFTLIEILISLSILALGVVIVFSLFPLSLRSLTYSRRLTEVYFLAEKKMEELKSVGNKTTIETANGVDGDLSWSVIPKTLQLGVGLDVIYLELDIGYDFMGHAEKQRFGTYFFKECNC